LQNYDKKSNPSKENLQSPPILNILFTNNGNFQLLLRNFVKSMKFQTTIPPFLA